jgi:hypothetical protein
LAPKASLLEAQKELDRAAVLDGNEAEVGYLDAVCVAARPLLSL